MGGILELLMRGDFDGKESACSAGDPGSILGSRRSLEKEMATHSSILARGIPWTEEPDRLQFMGLQRVDMTELLTDYALVRPLIP